MKVTGLFGYKNLDLNEVLLLRLQLGHQLDGGVVLAASLVLTPAPSGPAEPQGPGEVLHHPRQSEAATTKTRQRSVMLTKA